MCESPWPSVRNSRPLAPWQQAAAYQDDAATYAPLYPTLGAQVFAGGLGGSQGSVRRDFDTSADTFVTLSWKIGAGGLFDSSRQDGAKARLRLSEIGEARVRDDITRQVVEAHAGAHYLGQQLKIAEEAIKNAEAVTNFRSSAKTSPSASCSRPCSPSRTSSRPAWITPRSSGIGTRRSIG